MTTPRRRRKDFEPLDQVAGTLATVPTATGDIPNSVESPARGPTHDEIARRAYQLYEARGGEHGRNVDDWFEAERELRQIWLHGVVDRSLATEGPYVAA